MTTRRNISGAFALIVMGLALVLLLMENSARAERERIAFSSVLPSIHPDATVPSGEPSPAGIVRFAVLGDTKGGNSETAQMAELLASAAGDGGLDAVIMVGDNLKDLDHGGLQREFLDPFAPLLSEGVPFFAALGNHDLDDDDSPAFELGVPEFHMVGRRYYTVSLSASVEVFVLDSTSIKETGADGDQMVWLADALAASTAPVKIAIMHHPIYGSSGSRSASLDCRELLEPLFIEHDVQLVFAGHQHVYERIAPQSGVQYFITGAGGHVSRDSVDEEYPILDGDDDNVTGMLWEIDGTVAHFQVMTSDGAVIDEGRIDL